jgi:hypothetical protein
MFEKVPSDLVQAAWGFVATWALAGLGRLLWHIQEVQRGHRQFFSIWLVWELLTALAIGFVAVGIAEYLGFAGNVAIAVVIVVSYLGPRGIEALLERVLSKHLPPKP